MVIEIQHTFGTERHCALDKVVIVAHVCNPLGKERIDSIKNKDL